MKSVIDAMKFPWSYSYDVTGEFGSIENAKGEFVAETTGPSRGAWHEDGDQYFTRIASLVAGAPRLLGLLYHRFDQAMDAAHDDWISRKTAASSVGDEIPTWRESSEYIGLIQEWADEIDILSEFYGEEVF